MNRRAWHLISTGHRPKDGASVICIFHSGEAIECYYDKEYDDFIPYDQEWICSRFIQTGLKHGVLMMAIGLL
jgi:hypothetical protein